MAGASANRFDLRRVKEATWGVTPSNPALTFTRNTGESLSKSVTTERSQEIRPDRTTADIIPVDASIGGSFEFEMSYGSYDDLIESAFMSTWVDSAHTGSLTTTTGATNNLTAASAGAFLNVTVGQVLALADFTDPTINRHYRVTGKADNQTLTLAPAPASAETATATIAGSWIKNGTIEQSYTFVKRFNDATPVTTQIFKGMRVTGFSLDMSTASLITGSWNLMGASGEWGTDPAFSGETNIPAATTTVMNAVTNITDISMDGVGLCATGSVSNLTFELDNQHREQKGLCRLGNVGVVAGQLLVNVSGSQYFVNSVEAQKFEDSEAFEFSFAMEDPEGNAYFWTIPRAKYESFEVNATGLDTDVMAETSFTGLYDPGTNAVIILTRIPAVVPSPT